MMFCSRQITAHELSGKIILTNEEMCALEHIGFNCVEAEANGVVLEFEGLSWHVAFIKNEDGSGVVLFSNDAALMTNFRNRLCVTAKFLKWLDDASKYVKAGWIYPDCLKEWLSLGYEVETGHLCLVITCAQICDGLNLRTLNRARIAFEAWYDRYGLKNKVTSYKDSLAYTRIKQCLRKIAPQPDTTKNPPLYFDQNIQEELYPQYSAYEYTDPVGIQRLIDDSGKYRFADDGSFHAALAYYRMWIRLVHPFTWARIQLCENDDKRIEMMLREYQYDYLQELKEAIKMAENRQMISYGAPGTGKSYLIDAKTANEKVYRTTFHPDTDYSSFVGAYKPSSENGHIVYSFGAQSFLQAYVDAWRYKTEALGVSAKTQFLVVEEINRGNCAQIFGDLFQLLDRKANGYSAYPISPDSDLTKFLATAFDEFEFNATLKAEIESTYPDYDGDIAADVKAGKVMSLPPNLYIWATMNTSDQSLFPIDSAFKRRWDWKYVPIREGKYKDGPKQGQKMNWKIRFQVPQPQQNGQPVPDKVYNFDWWEFLKNINKKIFKVTDSEDKELGYFFVKPDGEDATTNDGTISADRFVGKVVFYLWNDVFKDYGIETIFKAEDAKASDNAAKGVAFQSFFNDEGDNVNVGMLLKFFKHIELKSDEEIAETNQQGQNANP